MKFSASISGLIYSSFEYFINMLKRCHSWVLKRTQEHKDFHINSFHYEHQRLGTTLLHLSCADAQKAFALMFRTPPPNNSGVSHCLERLTSYGSSNYRIHNPILNTLPFSQSSFASAWTGSDFTMFPFSTINPEDFKNLLSIYLDSCFFPLLTYPDFLYLVCHTQESTGELKYNGIIYNEMKEKIWDSNEILIKAMMKELYSGTCYEFSPGGEFLELAKLTHGELAAYHQEFYHPSNAVFFFYGDMDVMQYAEMLDAQILHKFEKKKIESRVKIAKNKLKNDQIYLKLPNHGVKTGKFVKSYLCDTIDKDYYSNFLLNVLSTVLFDSQNAPLYKALIINGLGTELIPGYGFDQSTRQGSFMVALDGVNPEDDKKIELAIKKTLEELVKNGIDSHIIEDALHQVEIKYKEAKPNFGLQIMSSMIPYTLHSLDPFVPLYFNSFVDKLRVSLAQCEPVFENLIEKYLLTNKNNVQILATPDNNFINEYEKLENSQVQKLGMELYSKASEFFAANTKDLENIVNNSENTDILPALDIKDLNVNQNILKFTSETSISGVKVKYLLAPTNGLTYIRLKSNILDLPDSLRDLLPLYRTIINHLGTAKRGHNEFNSLKQKYTVSGITTSFISSSSLESLDTHSEQFVFKIAFLDRNLDNAFEIFEEFLTQVSFEDTENLTNLIQIDVKNRSDGLLDSGNLFGASLASSSLTAAGNSYEPLRVLKHDCLLAAQLLTSLSKSKKIVNDVSTKLRNIHSFILNKSAIELLVHTNNNEIQSLIDERLQFLENSLRLSYPLFELPRVPLDLPQFQPFVYQAYFTLPIEWNYVNEAFLACHYLSEDFPALKILSELINLSAYSEKSLVTANMDPFKGSFVLSTYRDPENLKTFNLFEKIIWAVTEGKSTEHDIKKAKIATFTKLDSPTAVYEKGLEHFLYGKIYKGLDSDAWKNFRKNLTQVSRADLLKVAEKYLAKPLERGLSSKVVFGKEDVNKKELKDAGWVVQPPIEIISNT